MTELSDRDRRIATNENAFRRANESLEEEYGQDWPHGRRYALERFPFMCECGLLACKAAVTLELTVYERIRKHPIRFVIATGHKQIEDEVVVMTGEGFQVVEKTGEAAEIAAADSRQSQVRA